MLFLLFLIVIVGVPYFCLRWVFRKIIGKIRQENTKNKTNQYLEKAQIAAEGGRLAAEIYYDQADEDDLDEAVGNQIELSTYRPTATTVGENTIRRLSMHKDIQFD